MTVPSSTVDLIRELEVLHPDRINADPDYVGTAKYWMEVGVIELVRKLKYALGDTADVRDISAIGKD